MLPLLASPHGCTRHQLHHPQRPRGARRHYHQLHRHQRCKAAGERSVFQSEALPYPELRGVLGLAHHGQPGANGGKRVGLLGGAHLPLPLGRPLDPPLSHLRPLCNLPSCLHDRPAPGEIDLCERGKKLKN